MTLHIDPKRADVPALLAEYRTAAVAHRLASRAGNHKLANKAHGRLVVVVRELRARGRDAQAELCSLLMDSDVGVRAWAAAHALEFAPQEAEVILEQIAAGSKSLEEFSAKMVLQQWRGGTLKFP